MPKKHFIHIIATGAHAERYLIHGRLLKRCVIATTWNHFYLFLHWILYKDNVRRLVAVVATADVLYVFSKHTGH